MSCKRRTIIIVKFNVIFFLISQILLYSLYLFFSLFCLSLSFSLAYDRSHFVERSSTLLQRKTVLSTCVFIRNVHIHVHTRVCLSVVCVSFELVSFNPLLTTSRFEFALGIEEISKIFENWLIVRRKKLHWKWIKE